MTSEGAGSPGPRRVVVVVAHAASAGRIRSALDRLDDLQCVGVACTTGQACALIDRSVPDVVVVDLSLRGSSGLDLVRHLRSRRDDLILVIISTFTDVSGVMAAAVAGANGFAPKSGAVDELVSVLRSARPGRMSVAPSVLAAAGTGAVQGWSVGRLTARESLVLAWMGRGASASEIARVLNMSPSTSRKHIMSIHGKLGVRTRQEAVARARQIGLLDPVH